MSTPPPTAASESKAPAPGGRATGRTPRHGARAPDERVPIALIKVGSAGSTSDRNEIPDEAALKRRARYTAGVEYLANAFSAAQPLVWQGDSVMLVLSGDSEETLPDRAFQAAKEVWERVHLELNMPVRIAAHVGSVPSDVDPTAIAAGASTAEDVDLCDRLLALAPSGAIVLSEDVALALPDSVRSELAPIGVTAGDHIPVFVFPPGAAARRDPDALLPGEDERLWDALRAYALGPEVRLVRYVGFRLQKKQPPSLDIRDVFIAPEAELRVRADPGRTDPLAGDRSRPRAAEQSMHERAVAMPFQDLFALHRSLVVLGDPGSGKTTLLRWLAVMAAGGRFTLGAHLGASERLLPVPVSVGRLAEVRRSFPGAAASVPAALARYLHDRGLGEEDALRGILVRQLTLGHCLVLLDGLDEVLGDERQEIRRWLEAFAAAYPANRFIASSRIVGYGGFELPGGSEGVLRPFDKAQVEQYVRAWSRAYFRWETGDRDNDAADEEAEKLLEAISASPRLEGLAANPFMLSALALIHRSEGRLPRHRIQAYEIFARALCETWAEARRLVAGQTLDATIAYEEEALPILGGLALSMHERYPAGVAPESFVMETLARELAERNGVSGEEATLAARAFLERAGNEVLILVERGAGEWGFLHLTFQEFFAAAGLHAAERFGEVALEHLFDPRWEEVLRLGVGYLALLQKRPVAAQRFVETVLDWEEPEPRRWITRILAKQVPLAALLAAEAGDALPVRLQERIAETLAAWVCDPPSEEAARQCLYDLRITDFADRVQKALLGHLSDADPHHRERAVSALGLLGASAAIQPLVTMLSDASAEVRRQTIDTLSTEFKYSLSPSLLRDALRDNRADVRAAAIQVLLVITPERAEVLRTALRDPNEAVRQAALDAPVELQIFEWRLESELEVEILLSATQDESARIRSLAAFFLGRPSTKTPEVVSTLWRLAFHDEDKLVRAEAVMGFYHLGSESIIDAILAIVSDAEINGGVRYFAAQSLAKINPRAPVEQRLLSALQHGDDNVRTSAAYALGFMKSDAALNALSAAASDRAPTVRQAVLNGLFATRRKAAGQFILTALHDPDADVRLLAARYIGFLGLKPGFDALLFAARHDETAGVRCEAASALSRFHDARVQPVLIEALGDEDAAVRRAAISSLGPLGSEATVAPLLAALSDEERAVREAAMEALGELGAVAAVSRLIDMVEDGPAARRALWEIAERQALLNN